MSELIAKVAEAIEASNVELEPGQRRSVGYYMGVGIDHYPHPYDQMYRPLLEAAARAAIEIVQAEREGQ